MKLINISHKVYPDNFELRYYFILAHTTPTPRFQFASKWSSNQNMILRVKYSVEIKL